MVIAKIDEGWIGIGIIAMGAMNSRFEVVNDDVPRDTAESSEGIFNGSEELGLLLSQCELTDSEGAPGHCADEELSFCFVSCLGICDEKTVGEVEENFLSGDVLESEGNFGLFRKESSECVIEDHVGHAGRRLFFVKNFEWHAFIKLD